MKTTKSVSSSKSYRFKQINQYKMKQLLGNGTVGAVQLCQNTQDKKLYAMKIIKRYKLKTWGRTGAKILPVNEMEVLKGLVHTNIVKLHEIIDDPLKNKLYLVMDYLPGGTLAEKLRESEGGLPELEVRSYFRDLISALHYCHEVKMLAHRDIKPENMMLSPDGKLILCDFGVSQFFEA